MVTVQNFISAGKDIVGLKVYSNRSDTPDKRRGEIVAHHVDTERIDIKWPDGAYSSSQYPGDYLLMKD